MFSGLLLAGCGSDHGLLLVIDTQTHVDVDALTIAINDSATRAELRRVVIDGVRDFPATVLFEAGERTPDILIVAVDALRNNVPTVSVEVEVTRDANAVTRVPISLDEP